MINKFTSLLQLMRTFGLPALVNAGKKVFTPCATFKASVCGSVAGLVVSGDENMRLQSGASNILSRACLLRESDG